MNTVELKNRIYSQIDSLEPSKLEEFYSMMLNFFNAQKESKDWEGISEKEIKEIETAIYELDQGKGIPHSMVMEKYLNIYKND